MRTKVRLSEELEEFGMILNDQIMFLQEFWSDEMTLPMSTRQKVFHGDTSTRIAAVTARKTSKTIGIEARVIRKGIQPYNKTMERMIVTPGDKQLGPLRDRIISRINRVPLFKMLMKSFNRNDGGMNWHGGSIHYFRIDGTSGTDAKMIGLRCVEIIGDEMQLTNRPCHLSREQSALPGCEWMYCGVPDGRRDSVFSHIDRGSMGKAWKHRRMSTYANPIYWSIEQRDKLRVAYGGQNSPDYITQVLGQWGKEMLSVFPLESLAVHYEKIFTKITMGSRDIPKDVGDAMERSKLTAKMRIPRVNTKMFLLGMDYGNKADPTQLGLWYLKERAGFQRRGLDDCMDWYQFMRIQLLGCDIVEQAILLEYLVEILGMNRVGMICIDLQGPGQGLGAYLRKVTQHPSFWSERLIDFNAGGTIEVTDKILEDEDGNTRLQNKPKKVPRKVYFTNQFQLAMISARSDADAEFRMWMADDEEAVQELISTRETKTESGKTKYIPPMKSPKHPIDHITDMYRSSACAAFEMKNMESVDEEDDQLHITDSPLFGKPRTSSLSLPILSDFA